MAYHVVLDQFEGPLDLLLHLIHEAQIDIRDVFVSEITDQFLSYVQELGELDMNRASEFIAMAARLLEIKSRRLLPRTQNELEENLQDAEEFIIQQLEAYKQFKLTCDTLRQLMERAGGVYYRLPEEMIAETSIDMGDTTAQELAQAFRDLISRFEEDQQESAHRQIHRDTFTIQEKMFYIRSRLVRNELISFRDLFGNAISRDEVIVTFIALLELIKLNHIRVTQDRYDTELMISSVPLEA